MQLETLIDRFRGPLIGLIASWGASPADALEIAQDTFSEAYLSRARFQGDWQDPQATGAWLRGIASHLHSRRGRQARSQERIRLAALEEQQAATPSPASASNPEHDALREALARLKGSWRSVLHMRYVEGSPLLGIGALLGLSERAVEGRLRRAREALRQELERAASSAPGKDKARGLPAAEEEL